ARARAVVLAAEGDAEAVAERRREQPRARRRADERERRQVERQRARSRALSDDDVEPEVLERRIQDLLDRAVEPVDLVDEEDVMPLEPREDGRHVPLALERRPRHTANADAALLADDVREARLPEARRPDEQDVVERLVARLRGGQGNCELILDARLPDELGQAAWTERLLELLLLGGDRRRQELGAHLMLLSTPDGRVPPAAAPRRPRRGPALPLPRSSRARRARRARRDAVACLS